MTPDGIAECYEGVGFGSPLYKALWKLVPQAYKDSYEGFLTQNQMIRRMRKNGETETTILELKKVLA